jgi:hypothetical protein
MVTAAAIAEPVGILLIWATLKPYGRTYREVTATAP